jgi:hypothetical protein
LCRGGPALGRGIHFEALSESACLVTVDVNYEPQGILETLGDLLGVFAQQVNDDLELFKQFVEATEVARTIWRAAMIRSKRFVSDDLRMEQYNDIRDGAVSRHGADSRLSVAG